MLGCDPQTGCLSAGFAQAHDDDEGDFQKHPVFASGICLLMKTGARSSANTHFALWGQLAFLC